MIQTDDTTGDRAGPRRQGDRRPAGSGFLRRRPEQAASSFMKLHARPQRRDGRERVFKDYRRLPPGRRLLGVRRPVRRRVDRRGRVLDARAAEVSRGQAGERPRRGRIALLARIGGLYRLEAETRRKPGRNTPQGWDDATWHAHRYEIARLQRSRPILDAFTPELEGVRRVKVLPKSPIGEAIGYALNHWAALMRHLGVRLPGDRTTTRTANGR